MGKRNLKKQFIDVINSTFSPGTDKHSYVRSNATKHKIVGFETRRQYIKVIMPFVNYLNKTNNEIKEIRDIRPYNLQDYVNKNKDLWGPITMLNYKSIFKMIEKDAKNFYHSSTINFTKDVIFKSNKNEKIRNEWMNRADLENLIKYKEEHGCTSKCLLGLKIAATFGLRVSEICKLKGNDINLKYSNLHIHESKGKRSRDLPLNSSKKLELARYIKENIRDNERIVPVREDTLNQFLRRSLVAMGITKYRIAKTGVHAIRKMVASEEYNNILKNTKNVKKAEKEVSKQLGHNKIRKEISDAYIQKY